MAIQSPNKIYNADLAKLLFEAGLPPIPIVPRKKYPDLLNWAKIDLKPIVENWAKNYQNYGIVYVPAMYQL